jgi:PAS domain S-box-containing protein
MPYGEYFRAATEGLIIVDRAGQILEANPAAVRLFGYLEEELKGQPIELLLPEQLRELHRTHVEGYLAAPRTREMGRGLSLAGRRKDGSEFPVEISLTFARGSARGDLVVAAIIDISQRLALEQEVRRAETLTTLGTLAAGIAHDLNNPLQVIRSRSELLLESPDAMPASEMREDHAAIHRQAQRASAIIEEFLQLSRQREKVQLPVDINELVDRALLLVGDQLRKVPRGSLEPLDGKHRAPGVARGAGNDPAGSNHQSDRQAADVGTSERDPGYQRSANASDTAQSGVVGNVGSHGPAGRPTAPQADKGRHHRAAVPTQAGYVFGFFSTSFLRTRH